MKGRQFPKLLTQQLYKNNEHTSTVAMTAQPPHSRNQLMTVTHQV